MNDSTTTTETRDSSTHLMRDRDGEPVHVDRAAISALRGALDGATFAPGDDGYDEARGIWNAMIDRRPALVARCDGAGDVALCVRFARRHGVRLSVRGGGHNIGGRAVADGALTVDQSHRKGVRVDLEAGVAEVEPGATLGDLDRGTRPHGVVVPSGIVSQTGVAGLTLGGGFGWLSRRWGLTCDHLLSVEMVDAEGNVLEADDRSHPDLLWALRGGGGGLGVVTAFRFRVRRLADPVTAGLMVHTGRRAAVERYRGYTASNPEEVGSMVKLGGAPAAPWLPEALHGTPVVATLACHSAGVGAAVEADLAPLRAGEPAAGDVVQPRPFAEFQAMFDAGEPNGKRNYWKSEYVVDLDDETVASLLAATAELPSPSSNVKIFHLGGAVSRLAPEATAAGHRDARYIVVVATSWDEAADDEKNVTWVRDAWAAVHARSGRGGYVNFLTEEIGGEEAGAALAGVDLDRLAAVRRRYDPEELFAAHLPAAQATA